jgi:hypothetical protein
LLPGWGSPRFARPEPFRRLHIGCAAGRSAPKRSDAGAGAARPRLLPKLDARDIRSPGGLTKEESRFSFDTARLAAATLTLCRDPALFPRPVKPSDRARRAHPESFCRSITSMTRC